MSEVVLVYQEVVLSAVSRNKIQKKPKGPKSKTIEKWRVRWMEIDADFNWTRNHFITELRVGLKRKIGEINGYLIQPPTGHGDLELYLHSLKVRDNPKRCYCEERDTIHCQRWQIEG